MKTFKGNLPGILISALFAVACVLLAAPAPAQDHVGKTYFITMIGLEGQHDLRAGCIRFTNTEMCWVGGTCGFWFPTDTGTADSGLAFEIEMENSGLPLTFDGQMRVDSRGPRSSIGGAGRFSYAGARQNVAIAGRATSMPRCLRLAGEFAEMTEGWAHAYCMARAHFGEPAESPYILPFPVGHAYRVNQSYCSIGGSHHAAFGYDFNTPVGVPVLAARDGIVWMVYDEYEDGSRSCSSTFDTVCSSSPRRRRTVPSISPLGTTGKSTATTLPGRAATATPWRCGTQYGSSRLPTASSRSTRPSTGRPVSKAKPVASVRPWLPPLEAIFTPSRG